ncbi:unannotated protein [freshwater metagenome]|uniref:Unannotated protein n=1 Tax=freshwater metagenome TaxID=449393 RepID=A0A6J7HMW4_9ZZZZ
MSLYPGAAGPVRGTVVPSTISVLLTPWSAACAIPVVDTATAAAAAAMSAIRPVDFRLTITPRNGNTRPATSLEITS